MLHIGLQNHLSRFDAAVRRSPQCKHLSAVIGASWLLALSSWIAISIGPVPVTLQSLAVVLLGRLCGPRLAAQAACAYLAQGAAGLPVFAHGAAGAASLIGPTGGYLMGFVGAAWVTGALTDVLGRKLWASVLSMLAGHVIIVGAGVVWLAQFVGLNAAIAYGALPFIGDAAIKLAAGACLCAGIDKARGLRSRP